MLIVTVSPYHLTTREPASMGALLLGDRAVTMLPAPPSGRAGESVEADSVAHAAMNTPAYLDFMESWDWVIPLFRSGVIGSTASGQDPADDVRAAWERLNESPDYAELRPLMKAAMYDDDRAYLSAVARDLLKGGPDPAVSIPVAAGLDAFSSRNALTVARASSSSVAQRAEDRLGRKVASFAMPILAQAESGRIVMARESLADPLTDLRDAILDAFEGDATVADVRGAAGSYADAFDNASPMLTELSDDPDEIRVVTGHASVTLVELPADAVFRSSLIAARSLTGGRSRPAARSAGGAGTTTLATSAGVCRSMVIKLIGKG